MKYQDLYPGYTVVRRDGTENSVYGIDRDRSFDAAPGNNPVIDSGRPCPILVHTSSGYDYMTPELNIANGLPHPRDIMMVVTSKGDKVLKADNGHIAQRMPLSPSMQERIDEVRAEYEVVWLDKGQVSIKSLGKGGPVITLQHNAAYLFANISRSKYISFDMTQEEADLYTAYDYLGAEDNDPESLPF